MFLLPAPHLKYMDINSMLSKKEISYREFRCYEVKIEESEKASNHRESKPGHLACTASALPLTYNNQTKAALTILYTYCTSGTEMLYSNMRQEF